MDYDLFADYTAITHATIITAVVLGLLVSFRYKRFRPWEAGALVAVVIFWSYYGNCPLTILEQYFRDQADQQANLTSVGFLPYYAQRLLNISFSSKMIQHATFFTGGALFIASLEWLSPVMHLELFKFRKFLKRTRKKFA